MISQPRRLITTVTTPNQTYCLCTLHALDASYPSEERELWWAETKRHLALAVAKLIIGSDANARIGSIQSHSIGPANQDEEHEGGTLLHDALQTLQLWAPATIQRQNDATTWRSAAGTHSRIDYLLISQHSEMQVVGVYTNKKDDTLASFEDHSPRISSWSMRKHKATSHLRRDPLLYDGICMTSQQSVMRSLCSLRSLSQ